MKEWFEKPIQIDTWIEAHIKMNYRETKRFSSGLNCLKISNSVNLDWFSNKLILTVHSLLQYELSVAGFNFYFEFLEMIHSKNVL